MPDETHIQSSLDALAREGVDWLKQVRSREVLYRQMPTAIALLLVVPLIDLCVTGLGWLFDQPWKLPTLWVVLLCPLPTLLHLGRILNQLGRYRPSRRQGLAVFDEHYALRDRLQSADEFLEHDHPSPFMMAAVLDAKPAITHAMKEPLEWHTGKPWSDLRRLMLIPPLAIAMLIAGFLLPTPSGSITTPELTSTTPVILAQRQPLKPDSDPATSQPRDVAVKKPDREEERETKRSKGQPTTSVKSKNPSPEVSGPEKVSVGESEGGQTSQATSSGRSSLSRGTPGNQAPSSMPDNKPAKPKKKTPKKPGKDKEDKKARKKMEDKSGATAGRGSSSGSSRNPAATDWSSKDRTEETDNEEFEEEEDVDDEETESEARGGLQPSLRDRRPPVNRDLSIGFGNRANPDANGRGGPGQRKKSRGVAALVLGVPVPDHVKGQPNPGRVKINQERVQPQREDSTQLAAEDRGARSSPAGRVAERTLDASMRRVVRDYFLNERENNP